MTKRADLRSVDLRARILSNFFSTFVEYGGEVGPDEKAMLNEMVDVAMGSVDPLLEEIDELDEAVDERDARLSTPAIPTGYNDSERQGYPW